MIIIKCFGVDPYVVSAYSKKYIPLVKKRFEIADEFIVIAPDEYIFHDGVEQTSWHAIIEVLISPNYRQIEKELAHALISYFSEEVVNVRLFFNYIDEKSFYTLENKDYPPFVVESGQEIEEEIEPYTGDIFEEYEARSNLGGIDAEDGEHVDHHHHGEDEDSFH